MKNIEYPFGVTPLDQQEIDGLKLKHITTKDELDRWEQQNIQEAIVWLQNRKRKKDILNEKFVCQLHKKMFGKVWIWAGNYRRTNKNIGVEWTGISVALRQLLDDVNYWINNKSYTPDEIAYRFHHRIVWIHLFPNGNGRHARLIADMLLRDVLSENSFTWGNGNLTSTGDLSKKYIDALHAADQHDYSLLASFVRT
jgi:Fic-DOC domain mobile mystery protein B